MYIFPKYFQIKQFDDVTQSEFLFRVTCQTQVDILHEGVYYNGLFDSVGYMPTYVKSGVLIELVGHPFNTRPPIKDLEIEQDTVEDESQYDLLIPDNVEIYVTVPGDWVYQYIVEHQFVDYVGSDERLLAMVNDMEDSSYPITVNIEDFKIKNVDPLLHPRHSFHFPLAPDPREMTIINQYLEEVRAIVQPSKVVFLSNRELQEKFKNFEDALHHLVINEKRVQ